jgi:membrane protease YdiL (CAAX protease family)
MKNSKELRAVGLFALISFLFSWPIFFCAISWLWPMFSQQGNLPAARLSVLFGNMLAMLGPALAAMYMWRVHHKESPTPWKWGRPKYYLWVVLAMLAFWTLPGLIGLFLGDTVTSPIETYMWIGLAAMVVLGWITGMGEEVGWCAYLLPRLSPAVGKTRALVVSGALRGLWHWPVLVAPILAQVIAGERTPVEFIGAGVVCAIQLVLSNILFGAIFGWIWYRTESIPLVGWLHYWHDLARDMTVMLLVSYGSSLWVTRLNLFLWLPIGFLLLDQVLREEELEWKKFFSRTEHSKPDRET